MEKLPSERGLLWMIAVLMIALHLKPSLGLKANICTSGCTCDETGNKLTVTCQKGAVFPNLTELVSDKTAIQAVNFSGSYLTHVPQGLRLFTALETIDLSNNGLISLNDMSDNVSIFNAFPMLQEIYLTNNLLTEIKNGTFSQLKHIRTITLRNNMIHTIENGALSDTQTSLIHLDMSENSLTFLETFFIPLLEKGSAGDTHKIFNFSYNEICSLFNSDLHKIKTGSGIYTFTLDLSHNNLLYIDKKLLSMFGHSNLQDLARTLFLFNDVEWKLNDNPLHCDCHMKTTYDDIAEILQLLADYGFLFPDDKIKKAQLFLQTTFICQTPVSHTGKYLMDLEKKDLECLYSMTDCPPTATCELSAKSEGCQSEDGETTTATSFLSNCTNYTTNSEQRIMTVQCPSGPVEQGNFTFDKFNFLNGFCNDRCIVAITVPLAVVTIAIVFAIVWFVIKRRSKGRTISKNQSISNNVDTHLGEKGGHS